jgi:iron only hydrogenase large subunit-like protein
MTFEELYKRIVKASAQNEMERELEKIRSEEYDENHLDCLLNPQKRPPVWRTGTCDCPPEKMEECKNGCPFGAIEKADGGIEISPEKCIGCSVCIDNCKSGKLTDSKDIVAAINIIRSATGPVYALIAPAFTGQFSPDVTPGKLRNAFKAMGFDGMIEVAAFADILTLKEALEFDKNIKKEEDYQLTSCCCPMWIAMIKRIYHELIPHVPAAVSPMIACGRAIKVLHPDAATIFIGPCVAKKAEAKEPDIAGAIDCVLTFKEVADMFEAFGINPAEMEESEKDHSSRAGRIYARVGGVSEAVKSTVERINPNREISVKTRHADGVAACKAMVNDILAGKGGANFFEGMGCIGGCVGGPKALIPKEEGTENVNRYGDEAAYKTPIDNPYVIELLNRLGLKTIEDLLENSDIFTRNFNS